MMPYPWRSRAYAHKTLHMILIDTFCSCWQSYVLCLNYATVNISNIWFSGSAVYVSSISGTNPVLIKLIKYPYIILETCSIWNRVTATIHLNKYHYFLEGWYFVKEEKSCQFKVKWQAFVLRVGVIAYNRHAIYC